MFLEQKYGPQTTQNPTISQKWYNDIIILKIPQRNCGPSNIIITKEPVVG